MMPAEPLVEHCACRRSGIIDRMKRAWRGVRWLLAACALIVVLFAWNGLVLAQGETPVAGESEAGGPPPPAPASRRLRVLAWNLAKCFVYRGGLSFDSRAEVEARLGRMAAVIRAEDPDLVFLSEVVTECTPCDVDQVRFLSREARLPHWVVGENYSFGLPFLRVVGGNAILARRRIEPVANPALAGRKPFFATRNSRRVLLCRAVLGAESVLLGAMHTDSFDLANNLRQTRQILAFDPSTPLLLAGDFNAEPDSESMAAVVGSGRFTGALHGPATFPAEAPQVRIDYVFGPASWRLVDSRVLDDTTSDHRAVVATFELPR
jgi:endonuclease/exonuclease/phosphatase family metal-dependent hydrolase